VTTERRQEMLPAEVTRHRFTVEEYHKMGEAGIFGEDDRVELIDGEVVEMSHNGWRHARCVRQLINLLAGFALGRGDGGDRYQVDAQNPIVLSEHGEPRPDLALLREVPTGRLLPAPADVLVVVEVSDTTLAYNRNVKLTRYAQAGIPKVWIVDLGGEAVEVYAAPEDRRYTIVRRYVPGDEPRSETARGLVPTVGEVLG